MQRKRYAMEFKQQVLQEVREVGNAAQVARRHGLTPKVLYDWMNKSKHHGWQSATADAKKISSYVPSAAEFKELETENDRLKKILGDKDLEISILRDLLKKTDPA
ncbi:transposase [Alicyclobacillus sp. ALC3]|uniref:transposase n=1 Tax=Alicyclobacillus sp. ALC3 TaxID=2796143 RepID=UPI0023792A4B|nr:transposase [Alicyclobacillus sp. ALC3]WDL96629.1 transposase [Alicyclobacillus sp. ALC3]